MARTLPILVAAALLGCRQQAVPEDATRHVVVAVLDGVRPEESFGDEATGQASGIPPQEAMPESWSVLVPQGVRATSVWNAGSTITAPAHCAMVSGRRQALGNYPVGDGGVGAYRPELPGLPEELHRQRDLDPEHVVLLGNTDLIQPLTRSMWPGGGGADGAAFHMIAEADGTPGQDDGDVADALLVHLLRDRSVFSLANLHDLDRGAHYEGPRSLMEDIARLDAALPLLWQRIQLDPILGGNTWLVITADHGRHHDGDTEPPWRHHGDACNGCRRVPLLVLGPSVRAGETVAQPILLEDLPSTVAGLLGIDLPWSEGHPLGGLFEDLDIGAPATGPVDLRAAGGHRLVVELTGDPLRRKQVVLDGEVVSSPDAILAEAPALAAQDGAAWACWRELVLAPEGDASPWVARCLQTNDGGGTWTEIGWPEEQVGPFWETALLPLREGVMAAWVHNPNGITSPGIDGDEVGVAAARYDSEGWSEPGRADSPASFPTAPSLSPLEGGDALLTIAAAVADDRTSRRVFAARIVNERDGATPGPLRTIELGDLGALRIERPMLDGDTLRLAFLAYRDDGIRVSVHQSDDDGASWTPLGELDAGGGSALPHLTPVWDGDQVVFGGIDPDGEDALICRGTPGADATCASSGSPRVSGLALEDGTPLLAVDADVGEWELR